ncbi:MAG: DUF302 domain-containing protein [Pseudomonadota bacterium]
MPRILIGLVAIFLITGCTVADETALDTDVWMKFESPASVTETMDSFQAAVEARGLTVFARIDHSANAQKAGLSLEPNQVLIFGNPQVGTQLMAVDPDIGLDLPLKALVRQTSTGSVLVMHDPAAVATRYGIRTLDPLLGKMRSVLRALGKAATEA